MTNSWRTREWMPRVFFEPRDLWVGVYWTWSDDRAWGSRVLQIYVCVIPCLPVLFTINVRRR